MQAYIMVLDKGVEEILLVLCLKLIGIDSCLTLTFIVLWGFKRLNYVLNGKLLSPYGCIFINWNSPILYRICHI
jgi:hypothetical protein